MNKNHPNRCDSQILRMGVSRQKGWRPHFQRPCFPTFRGPAVEKTTACSPGTEFLPLVLCAFFFLAGVFEGKRKETIAFALLEHSKFSQSKDGKTFSKLDERTNEGCHDWVEKAGLVANEGCRKRSCDLSWRLSVVPASFSAAATSVFACQVYRLPFGSTQLVFQWKFSKGVGGPRSGKIDTLISFRVKFEELPRPPVAPFSCLFEGVSLSGCNAPRLSEAKEPL